ncbi:hypothetical protein ACP4OV_001239 [Aristida adscensionis]
MSGTEDLVSEDALGEDLGAELEGVVADEEEPKAADPADFSAADFVDQDKPRCIPLS